MDRVVLIAFGDEMLSGLRVERNCHWLASRLHDAGFEVVAMEILQDQEEAIAEALAKWVGRVDLIVTSGGLGSTHDDRTRSGFARYLGSHLVVDNTTYDRVVERYRGDIREIVEMSRSLQALVPANASSVYNPEGSGLGIHFERSGTRVFAFPGIPLEFRSMSETNILSAIESKGFWTRVHIAGWAESLLKDRISTLTDDPGLHISILPSPNLVEIIIRGEERAALEAERSIRDSFPGDALPRGVCSLPEALFHVSLTPLRTFAFAESCTGGLLGASITDIPGISQVFQGSAVCYSNEAKVSILYVPPEVLSLHGAVSKECALAMAEGARKRFGSDYALSVTGIAGPDGGTQEKPVGTIWIGVSSPGSSRAYDLFLSGNREMIRKRTLFKGIEILWKCIRDDVPCS